MRCAATVDTDDRGGRRFDTLRIVTNRLVAHRNSQAGENTTPRYRISQSRTAALHPESPLGVAPRSVERMRVVAGELRGRRIESPEGKATRPTTDMAREAIFNSLGSHYD